MISYKLVPYKGKSAYTLSALVIDTHITPHMFHLAYGRKLMLNDIKSNEIYTKGN